MDKRDVRRNGVRVQNPKNKWKVALLISILFSIFIYYQVYVLLRYTTGKSVTEGQMTVYKWIAGAIHKTETVTEKQTLKIGVAGNIIIDDEVTNRYIKNGKGNYGDIFENISFKDYDCTIASLNTDIAQGNNTFSKGKANSNLLSALKDINIDLLVTSTKELGKLSSDNLKQTVRSINSDDIKTVGSSEKESYYILEKNGIKVAILGYVGEDYSSDNGISKYTSKKFENDIKEINSHKVDCRIVFVDTKRSGKKNVEAEKTKLLENIINLGADIVISNDNIEQRLSKKEIKEGKNTKTAYIKYSLGDVIGKQKSENSDVSKVLGITIEKEAGKKANEVRINVTDDKTLVALSNDIKTKYKIVELDKAINEYDSGNEAALSLAEYNYLKKIKDNIK